MHHSKKPQKNKTQDISQKPAQLTSDKTAKQLKDNRQQSAIQKKQENELKNEANDKLPVQKKTNNTGLPDNLKSGIENLSGHSMDDVKVHFNSSQPAQLNAHAYAQGVNIHISPGQEKHLPHEAWHVVQQKQGRVKPTVQLKDKVNINDDKNLEKEADTMGTLAMQAINNHKQSTKQVQKKAVQSNAPLQRYHIQDTEGFFLSQEERNTENGKTFLSEKNGEANLKVRSRTELRVADSGELAVEVTPGREAKIFYGTQRIQEESNKVLKQISSPIRLGIHTSMTIVVRSSSGAKKVLYAYYPIDVMNKQIGDEVKIPERCDEAAPHILNTRSETSLQTKFKKTGWAGGFNKETIPNARMRILNYFKLHKEIGDLEKLYSTYWKSNFIRALANPFLSPLMETRHDNENKKLKSLNENIKDPIRQRLGGLFGEFFENDENFIRAYAELINTGEGKKIAEEAGINEFIDPGIGEMLSIRTLSGQNDTRKDGEDHYVKDHFSNTEIKNPFPFHYASVIAKSGSDYITIENYARRSGNDVQEFDPRYFFKMYGTGKQSFHEESKGEYPNPLTLLFGKQPKGSQVPEFDIESPQFGEMQNYYNSKLNHMSH
jgi:hypothetical protein